MRIVAATHASIGEAARHLAEGGLVVIPTETVYGIAADATQPGAVRRIFEVKGRPSENPLIVHVSDVAMLETQVQGVPEWVRPLVDRFMPGPLTVVLPKAPNVPDIVTGGLPTVAVRMPEHPVPLSVIAALGRPLAVPSANRFMHLSPTKVEHIDPAIGEAAAMVLDGGPCSVGVESTVVDATSFPPRILRPGGVSRGMIQEVLGTPLGEMPPGGERRSPGMYARHYAPRATLLLVRQIPRGAVGFGFEVEPGPTTVRMPKDPVAYAASLYDVLHRLDQTGAAVILAETPPDTPAWEAVHDRLRKAGQPSA
ncbi:MAG: L-threonylcarbamoyladenylate synthase [Fimbriimonadaceae bacterium]